MSRDHNYTPMLLTTLVLLLVGLIVYQTVAASATVEGPLFIDATTTRLAYDNQENALRSRAVTVNFDKLAYLADAQNTAVEIQLFDDVSFTAQHKQTIRFKNGGYVWVGTDPQNPFSEISLSVYGNTLVGTFHMYEQLYNIRYVGNEVHVIQQLPLNYRLDAEPLVVEMPANTAALPTTTNTPQDDPSAIDVLVVYTPKARNAVGGTNAMQALIDLAISETNTGYENSGVNFEMRLVGSQEVAYTENTGAPDYNEFSNALIQITAKNDGVIDDVHALRNAYAADTVAFIIDGTSFCGIAWLMSTESPAFESSAFSVTDWSCATGYYSFGHEIGHNMGSSHDRVNGNQGVFSYSYGYQDPAGNFRTIMAYFNGCGGSCPRVNYWSNPAVNYNNLGPTGVESNAPNSAANFLSLNNTVDTVANFRTSLLNITPTPSATATSTPTHTPTATPIPTLQTTVGPQGGSANSGYFSIVVPPGMVNESIIVHFEALGVEDLPALPDDSLGVTNYEFNLLATYESSGLPAVPEDGTTYAVTILYEDNPFGPLNLVKENTLALYYWDDFNEEWVLEATSLLDVDLNTLRANPNKFGTWAVFGEGPKRVFLPLTTK